MSKKQSTWVLLKLIIKVIRSHENFKDTEHNLNYGCVCYIEPLIFKGENRLVLNILIFLTFIQVIFYKLLLRQLVEFKTIEV